MHKDKLHFNDNKAPKINTLQTINLAEPNKITLSNNLELYYLSADNIDLIKLTIIFKDNSIWNKQDALNSLAVSKLIKEGTKGYTSDKLKSIIEFNGAKLFTSANSDYISIDLYVIKENFAKIIGTVKKILTEANFPETELDKFINESKNRLLANSQKNQYLANQAFKASVFGSENKLGYKIKIQDFDNLRKENLIEYYKENFRSNNCVIIATGNISKSDIQLLTDTFVDLPSTTAKSTNVSKLINLELQDCKQSNKKHLKGIGKFQSTIIIGKRLPNRNHPDYIKLQILNTVLGGYFGSYLMKNLREEKGYTYGVHSMIISNLVTGIFYINTEVNIKNYKSAVSEIYNEIERLSTTYITDATISTIKNYLLGEFRSSIKNVFSYSTLIKSLLFYNVSYPDYYNRYFKEIESIDKKELKTLASKYFSSDFNEVIVGM